MTEERTDLMGLLRRAHAREQEKLRYWEQQQEEERQRRRGENQAQFRRALALRVGQDTLDALDLRFVFFNDSYEWTSAVVGVVHVNGRDVHIRSNNGHHAWSVWIPNMRLPDDPYSTTVSMQEGKPDVLLSAIYRWATEAIPDPQATSADE